MPRVLQVSCSCNSGAIGRIAEQINACALSRGWEVYYAYGRVANLPVQSQLIRVGCMADEYWHYFENRLFDKEGLSSINATIDFVNKIKDVTPDIIHLHNIHDHWLNYGILFEYLNQLDTPIVWTMHDCWAFTGGCGHYSVLKCNQWMTCCEKCVSKKNRLQRLFEKTQFNFRRKKELFSLTPKLILVPVSKWLEGEIRQSFLKDKQIQTIYNGVDTSVFKPVKKSSVREKYQIGDDPFVVGVATAWSERKGLSDYKALSLQLSDRIKIVLVGLPERLNKDMMQYGIIGIPRTENMQELAALYSEAEIVMNLSYEETFGMTTVEGFACGTPSIVYNNTASPELVTEKTGIIVQPGNIAEVKNAINNILETGKPYYSGACRERAVRFFNKEDRFNEYINLYERVVRH